ncbi:heparinase II/III-like protein [Bordetella hinzii CA90 BAL1384]|uniref:heparinase II/III domain-containing protein n=1 Tax=Bordetella hinzii TaxID=103855 RepID=UPI0004596AB9|nr:heparinase II/III family protein [Bordetella hinzii]KCB30417.1 heparinase II/III-like protein [Bordetella hinzii CA90 BAL1384]KCB42354.1 heparinase II/III-like protein [Bordetella hinzii 5132]
MIAFEKLDNSVAESWIVPRAEEILQNGWRRRGYDAIDLSGEIPWTLESHEKRSHNFYIQCLDMIDPLLRAYSLAADRKYLDVSLPISLEWVRRHSDPAAEGISPFAWYDMSVGMRAYRLAYLLQASEEACILDDQSRQLLWKSLEQHADYLASDDNIAFHNNHGYYQVAGQVAMGRRFSGKSSVMANALKQGHVRLTRMLEQQFTPDGVHREHSPDYHRMVCDTLKALIDSGLIEDEDTIAFAKRIEVALSWFVLPDQHIVNFGDSDNRLLARKPKDAMQKWSTPEMRFWVSGGKIGDAPKSNSRAFQEGGYWIARKHGTDTHDLASYSYLALNAAFHSRTHKHSDDLSFVWFDRGTNILVDAGRYGYIGKAEKGSTLWLDGYWYSDPWRVYCESTRAHNVLEFDGRNYPRKGVKPYGSALTRWGEHESGLLYAEAECKQFGSIRQARVLVLMPTQWLLVFDWFYDNTGGAHSVKQWFHLSPQLQLLVNDEQYMSSVSGSRHPLRVGSLLAGPAPSRLYLGEEGPEIQGWWSAKERDVTPNYAFNYSLQDASNGAFATLFCFSDSLSPDVDWSKVNISGRKGQFRWRDANKIHELRLERPEGGEMTVSYIRR